jgi:EAL domain-containing protein (putative c-di-GMP-specific phosphodiesterase class I)
VSATSIVALIREAIDAPAVGEFGPGRLIVEVSGLGWSRGEQLSALVEALLAVIPLDRLDLALGGDSAEDSMRLALAEVRARFGVAVVLTCTPSSSNPLSLVESENPRALLLAGELVASLDASHPRTTLVRMVAAIADVLGVPIIARGAESPSVITALGALGCQLITTRLPARHITEAHQ